MNASRTFVAGGDGVDYVSLVSGNTTYGSLGPVQQAGYTQIEEAAGVLPELWTVPELGAVALSATTAFAVGWKIGSTVNTKWLHLGGVGLGFNPHDADFHVQWKLYAGGYANARISGPAWLLYNATTSSPVIGTCGTAGFGSCGTLRDAWWNQLGRVNETQGSTASYHGTANIVRYIPAEAMHQYLAADQPLQPWTGQPAGIVTGWPNPGSGAGITQYPVPPFGGGPTSPIPQEPTTQSAIDGADDPTRNEHNCRLDPTDYACPTTNSDGTQYTTNGGEKVAVPDCYGMTVADCEAAIEAAGGTVTFSVGDASSADPNVADGYVVSTTPSTRVVGNPTTVQIGTNPANDDPPACTSRTDNPHWSDTPPIFTVLAKGWLRCNFAAVVEASGFMWRCTDNPVTDQVALDLGEYGCQRVATASPQAIDVQPAVWSQTPVLIPNNAVVDQAPGYWIASTVGQGVVQSFSQLGWGWISDGVFGAIQ